MERYLGLTLLLISIISPALSFSTGAPQAACQTLAPDATRHGAQPQVTDIPYVLNLSAFYDPALNQMVYTPNTVYNSKIIDACVMLNPTFPVVNDNSKIKLHICNKNCDLISLVETIMQSCTKSLHIETSKTVYLES
jgi:hypothetical protein